MNQIPILTARQITSPDGVRQLAFLCPECGRHIVHGWPQSDTLPTHRLAHCNCYKAGYYLTTNEQEAQHDS